MRIGEICTRTVVTCGRDASVFELAQRMREHHVGSVVVVDERDGRSIPVGIVTDRDLVVEVMARGVDPSNLRAGDLVFGELVTALESELVHDAVWQMRRHGIRRLPVVDTCNGLRGVLTANDLTRFLAEELSDVASIVPCQVRLEGAKRTATP